LSSDRTYGRPTDARAAKPYADYVDEHVKIDKLWAVFDAIDYFAP
jgi:hypothetical protein